MTQFRVWRLKVYFCQEMVCKYIVHMHVCVCIVCVAFAVELIVRKS